MQSVTDPDLIERVAQDATSTKAIDLAFKCACSYGDSLTNKSLTFDQFSDFVHEAGLVSRSSRIQPVPGFSVPRHKIPELYAHSGCIVHQPDDGTVCPLPVVPLHFNASCSPGMGTHRVVVRVTPRCSAVSFRMLHTGDILYQAGPHSGFGSCPRSTHLHPKAGAPPFGFSPNVKKGSGSWIRIVLRRGIVNMRDGESGRMHSEAMPLWTKPKYTGQQCNGHATNRHTLRHSVQESLPTSSCHVLVRVHDCHCVTRDRAEEGGATFRCRWVEDEQLPSQL